MVTQLVLAAVAVTALIYATILSLNGSRWMRAAMIVVALVGLLLAGGVEIGQKKKSEDDGGSE